MSRKVVLGVVAAVGAAGAVAFAFLIVVIARQGLGQAGAWAGPLAALAGIVAAVAAVLLLLPPRQEVALPPELQVPEWVVDRPAELSAVVKALVDAGAGTVGITTGLYGAGGFGKTVLARMASADRRVRHSFQGRVYPVTLGRDVRGAAIAAKVNDLIKLMTGQDVSFTDPQLAGQHLGSVLDAGPRRLLVLDDVWEAEQLAPFTYGGGQCARLVTTRVPKLLAGRGPAVLVDQMSEAQARALLTAGLPPLEEVVVTRLLAVTGRWPLLLRLVSKILADYAQVAPDVSAQGVALVERLSADGPAVVDDVLGEDGQTLDVGQPSQRERAVRATIGASTGLLSIDEAERLAELGVFAEDETIPFGLVARLWRATAGLDELRAAQVRGRLAQLALVSQAAGPGGGVVLHDVIGDFLRARLGKRRLAELHGVLLDAVTADLPAAGSLDGDGCPVPVAWWELVDHDRYLWDHLVEHMLGAGRRDSAEAIASDLRWVGARLERFGPAASAADLLTVGTPRAIRLQAELARIAHLLAPTEPSGAVVDVLHSRVAEDPDWGPQVAALRDVCRRPRLVNRRPLPDLADPALRRVLTGPKGEVTALEVAPDSSWLAIANSRDGAVRIWDVATWQERATLTSHSNHVTAMAVAQDGSWLATGGDGAVRIWDVITWQERATLTDYSSQVRAMAVAPDGSWLATGGDGFLPGSSTDNTVRIWDTTTWHEQAILTSHSRPVTEMEVAPDGSWLATSSSDYSVVDRDDRDFAVRIWDVTTWQIRATLDSGQVTAMAVAPDGSWLATGSMGIFIWDATTWHKRSVMFHHAAQGAALAVAPDGSWLATGSILDGGVRVWDMATGRLPDAYITWVEALAVAPDGSWLATSGWDKVQISDMATERRRATLTGHTGEVEALAVAWDGSWLATGGSDKTVRIWDAITWQERAILTGHTSAVEALAVAPDGSWLATSGWRDRMVRIWDATTWQEQATLDGHFSQALAVAPDGSWLATSGWSDKTVRIWDTTTWQEQATLTPQSHVLAIAVAPDGTWLATGGEDKTVRIWDATTWQEQATLTGHSGHVLSVTVAPDGNWLATSVAWH